MEVIGMITTIYPCWDFKECAGYFVGRFTGGFRSKVKVYVNSLMAKMPRSTEPIREKISVKSANQLFINESKPRTPTTLISVNYVEAYVSDDVIKKKANEDLYLKYLRELPWPTPIYYIPFTVILPAGHKVSIKGVNNSLVELYAELE